MSPNRKLALGRRLAGRRVVHNPHAYAMNVGAGEGSEVVEPATR
jgi:hypothetical protein